MLRVGHAANKVALPCPSLLCEHQLVAHQLNLVLLQSAKGILTEALGAVVTVLNGEGLDLG